MQKMKDAGYEPMGHGCFGVVLGHPGVDYVIKVFINDPGYRRFLRFALANQSNPHVPKFRGKVMSIDGTYFAVRMEKLQNLRPNQVTVAGQIENYTHMFAAPSKFMMQLRSNLDKGYAFAKATIDLLEEQPRLLLTVDELRRVEGANFDLHSDNMMQRTDGTFVIVNPFFEQPNTAISEDWGDDEDDEKDWSYLKPSAAIVPLKPLMVKAAQAEYDKWQTVGDDNISFQDEYAGGGICHLIAEKLADIMGNHGIACQTVSSTNEVHVFCVAQCQDGVFEIDVPYRRYETGGGYNWQRIEGVIFDNDDVVIERLSYDPEDIKNYVEEWD